MPDEPKKPDFILPDGQQVFFDFSRITHGQWKAMLGPNETAEESDKKIALVAGVTVARLDALTYTQHRSFMKAFFEKSRNVLADPN